LGKIGNGLSNIGKTIDTAVQKGQQIVNNTKNKVKQIGNEIKETVKKAEEVVNCAVDTLVCLISQFNKCPNVDRDKLVISTSPNKPNKTNKRKKPNEVKPKVDKKQLPQPVPEDTPTSVDIL
jgi:hypothetical protein